MRELLLCVAVRGEAVDGLAEGATGAYDVHFERLARLLISRGQGDTTIRLGVIGASSIRTPTAS